MTDWTKERDRLATDFVFVYGSGKSAAGFKRGWDARDVEIKERIAALEAQVSELLEIHHAAVQANIALASGDPDDCHIRCHAFGILNKAICDARTPAQSSAIREARDRVIRAAKKWADPGCYTVGQENQDLMDALVALETEKENT
jgi:hypothetical protein